MTQTETTTSERDTDSEYADEVERMAAARADIEERLRERTSELETIGDFGTAYCTSFRDTDSGEVAFVFELPDGDTAERSRHPGERPDGFKSFLAAHGANSVTDMVGAEHACIYTDDGWELLDRQSVRPWRWHRWTKRNGNLLAIDRVGLSATVLLWVVSITSIGLGIGGRIVTTVSVLAFFCAINLLVLGSFEGLFTLR